MEISKKLTSSWSLHLVHIYGKIDKFLFYNGVYFLEQLCVHRKIKGKLQRFPISPLLPHLHSLPHYQCPHRVVRLLPLMDLYWRHHHPQALVHIRVLSGCTFHGLESTRGSGAANTGRRDPGLGEISLLFWGPPWQRCAGTPGPPNSRSRWRQQGEDKLRGTGVGPA